MIKTIRSLLLCFLGLLACTALGKTEPAEAPSLPSGNLALWYTRPAGQWIEGLPLGNGRLGAMVFGGIESERFQLNEDTLWSGGPYDPSNKEAAAALPEIRKLLFEGKYAEAQDLSEAKFMSKPSRQSSYQTMGDLLLTMAGGDAAKDYRRELNLETATATTEFKIGSVLHRRESFVSPVDQVLVIRHSAVETSRKGGAPRVSMTIAFQTPQKAKFSSTPDGELVMEGVNSAANGIAGALKFEVRVKVLVTGGSVSGDGSQLHVSGASCITIYLSAATSFKSYKDVSGDPSAFNVATLKAALGKNLDELKAAHVAEHQRLFKRVSLDLGHSEMEKRPTDERVSNAGKEPDPALASLYFQYGRYLLLCSSRPGSQPANLQGIWNDSVNPPWGSKYTININTQMNYWPAEVANLSECVEPLTRMVEDLSTTGGLLAKQHYGARGWVTHHNTDLWRASGPIDSAFYGMWPTGGAWLCYHLWEHYLFTGDKEYLARVYPLLRGASEFFLDTLAEEPKHGWLVTAPSMSPEHSHRSGVTTVAGPTMDEQIIRDLFGNCIEAAKLLGKDAEFAGQLAKARASLVPNQIGSKGQLQEWMEDWDGIVPDQRHKHVSHLYGFFPSSQISLRGTPDLAAAVRNTLESRGDISTGWAIAWRFNLWARMQDGDRAHRILAILLGPERTYPNLFDAHPPFQIDGNLGGASGIAELLLQSHAGEIELLPALPKAWPSGSVSGLRARGGFEVELAWENGVLRRANLKGRPGATGKLRIAGASSSFTIPQSGVFSWEGGTGK